MLAALRALLRRGRRRLRERWRRWLFQQRGPEPGTVLLTSRRVYIVPTRAGLGFAALLLVMLIGALNYNLGLGYALTFFGAACAVADMLLTARNLALLRLAPGRAPPVFAGDAAQFELLLYNHSRRDRYAIWLGFEAPDTAPDAHRATPDPAHHAAQHPARHAASQAARHVAADVAADVAAGASVVVRLAAPAPARGWLAAPRVRLVTRFPLGLFRAWSYWQPELRALVYPAPERPAPALPSTDAGGTDSQGAAGLDHFAGIRSYQAGDPLRHLAWRQIARHGPDLGGQLVTKQFEGGAAATLCLDFHTLPAQLDVERRLARMTGWVLAAEQRALPYAFRLGPHDYGPALGPEHQAACLRALALYGHEVP